MAEGLSRAPTLEDVAELAGVSRATAGRVLAGAGRTSPHAQEAVEAAAVELGYVANHAARALVTKRSDAVAFVVAENEDRFFADPFFPQLLRGVQSVVAAKGLQLIFLVASSEDDRHRLVNYAAGGHLDGAILVSLHGDDSLPGNLERRGVPVVVLGRPMGGAQFAVDSDNVGGAEQAVALLAGRGCKRIGTIAGSPDMAVGQDRLAGYRQGLTAAGLTFDETLVATGDFSVESGETAMRQLLSANLDGLFAANDLMALGAMRVLRDHGVAIPDTIAVVGFDDLPLAEQTRPALTTIRQEISEMGRLLADQLVRRIAGEPEGEPVIIPTTVVRRASA